MTAILARVRSHVRPRRWARILTFRLANRFGGRERYGIMAGYRHRRRPHYFDDTENEDEWQREVYQAAGELMARDGLRTVCDIGCGSGFKLVNMLGDYDTVGVDLPETIDRVRQRYPDRRWVASSFEETELEPADLVICADVIEHVADPDALMRFLVEVASGPIVLSTPDRDLIYGEENISRIGPPGNPSHLREWTRPEFARFVLQYLDIERHEISNAGQGTQMIIGRARR